jgi:DNA-binding CsgD family transcriptional regulator
MPRRERALLTGVEIEILDDAARGLTVKESAGRRWKSVWTVKAQRRSILSKLGARNMTHAVSLAVLRHLIAPMPADRGPGSSAVLPTRASPRSPARTGTGRAADARSRTTSAGGGA